MDMIREETVFGPIFSRRLGSSLGINLLPEKGKICNFDCIYCECGWNKDGRNDTVLPTAEKVRGDLERMLKKLVAEGTPVDSITFSGDGEPTLNPDFVQIIDDTLRLRNEYYPKAKVSVLSNATRVHIPEIFNALRKVDNPIMKIDAPTNELVERINKPAPGYDVKRVVEALKAFSDPNIVLHFESGDAVHQKNDVFKGIMWYSYTNDRSNILALPVDKVKEIITLNKKGEKPEKMEDYAVTTETHTNTNEGYGEADLKKMSD